MSSNQLVILYFSGYQCNYEAGFGYGGSQYYIGQKQSQAHCADDCHQMSIATNPNVNGASYEDRTRRCICKSQMRGRERSLTWKSCVFEAAAPQTTAVTTYKPISKVPGNHCRLDFNNAMNQLFFA